MAREVELKFDVEPGGMKLARAAPMLAEPPASEKELESVYFDTKKGALRDAGFSLRVRRSGDRYVQTVKRKRGNSTGLFVRQEWEADVAGFEPDPRALRRTPMKSVLEAINGDALVPLIRASVHRSTWAVERRGSRIEIVLDQGEVRSGKAKAPICELELEVKAGRSARLFELARELFGSVPLRLGVLSKSERGYALAEKRLGCSAKAEPIALDAAMTEGEAFRAVASACLRQYRLNEIVLLSNRDADAIHQARIALRRLRSALSLFGDALSGNERDELREELGWLASQLGDARDMDVMLAGSHDLLEDETVHARLLGKRNKAYDRVEKALNSTRSRELMLRLALWVELGQWRFRARSDAPLGELATYQLERQWLRVQRRGAHLGEADASERHRLRLDVKKLRYSAEFLAALYARRPKVARCDRFIEALKDLQDRLGDLNDAVSAGKAVAKLAGGSDDKVDRTVARAHVDELVGEAKEALRRASAVAGYWR